MTTDRTRRRFLTALGGGSAATAGCIALPGASEPTDGGEAALEGGWPSFGADARNTGRVETAGPADPVVDWEFETANDIQDGAVVADGRVFVGSTDGNLYAVDADTGEELWRFPVRGQVRTTPAVVGDLVIVGGRRGGLYALDVGSGEQRWSALNLEGFSLSHPTVADGTVYAGSSDGTLYALNAAIGGRHWSVDLGGRVAASPAVADGMVYVGWRGAVADPDDQGDGGLTALTTDGERRWQVTDDTFDGSPAVVDGIVYAVSRSGAHAFDADTGDELWQFEGSAGAGSPAVADGTVYVGSHDSVCYALDAATGEVEWEQHTGKWPTYAPAVADDVVHVPSWAGRVYGLDADDGEPRWKRDLETPLSDPAVLDGTVYVATENSLVALRDG